MKVVVVSGKGGTGKTTITASFLALSQSKVLSVDCDVDASNLHLMYPGVIHEAYAFYGAKVAKIDTSLCIGCDKCLDICRFDAIQKDCLPYINELKCEGCGACRWVCKSSAIKLHSEQTGQVILSAIDKGYLSRAEMIPGQEGSGKLVSEVREQADKMSKNQLLDGSPGIGCSVIASITATDVSVVVTEPTQSGLADLKRVLTLVTHFDTTPYVIINKYDLNELITETVEAMCLSCGVEVIGRIPYDALVNDSINQGIPIVNYEHSIAGQAIKASYVLLEERMSL